MAGLPEPEVMIARRAFPQAQALMAGPPLIGTSQYVRTGWHDSSLHPLEGAFALIDPQSGLDDLIGEVLAVHYRTKTIYVYCYEFAGMVVPFSLYRRAFLALELLTAEEILTRIEVVA